MANNVDQCKDRCKTVEDYGLLRTPHASDLEDLNFMQPYIGPGPYDWQEYSVWIPSCFPNCVGKGTQLNQYAVSVTHAAHVNVFVGLTAGDLRGASRYSEMRYRDMLADNLCAAGTPLGSVRFLGTSLVANDPAREAIADAFQRAGKDVMARGVVHILAGDAAEYCECIERNPLARSHHNMAANHGGVSVRRFVLISEGFDGPPGSAMFPYYEPKMHMVTELE